MICFCSLNGKPNLLLSVNNFSFSIVINYLFFDFFTKNGSISAELTAIKKSLFKELLHLTVQREVKVHHEHISIA